MEDRLLLFDIDGTLIDAGGAGRRALLVAFGSVFALESTRTSRPIAFAGKTDRTLFGELAAALHIEPAALDRRWDELEEAYLQSIPGTKDPVTL